MKKIKPNEMLDIREILKDLEHYVPKKRGWVWRDIAPQQIGEFTYVQASPSIKNFVHYLVLEA